MKTIQIDDDLYAYLVGHTKDIGESASSILRRLLGVTGSSSVGDSGAASNSPFDFLNDWDSLRHLTQTRKFLHILSWAYQKHQGEFEKLLTIEGRRRKYFSRDEKALMASGSSTNPRPIPDSPFWVTTNNSTIKKAEILSDAFRVLGYKPEDVQAMLARF